MHKCVGAAIKRCPASRRIVATERARHIAAMSSLPDFIRFASEATILGIWAGALLAISIGTAIGDWRRRRRRHIDAVGWVPWRDLSAVTAFAGLVLLAMAVSGWAHR